MDPLEKKLIDSLRNGNKKAFELVFKSYYSKLCRYSFGIVKQREVAEDLVKDFFLKLWENPEKLNIHSSLLAYFVRSIHNSSINYMTREKVHRIYISDEEKAKNILDEAAELHHPLSEMLLLEVEDAVLKAIEELPEKCRTIFELSRNQGMSHYEIAQQMNISENTVKVHIYNALSSLKSQLKPFLSFFLVFINLFYK